MSTDLNEWEQPKADISLEDMDNAAKALRDAKEVYTSRKAASDEAYHIMKEAEGKLVSLMDAAGKTTYIAEGVGRATVKKSLSVKTPKSPEQKQAFFNWIREHMGEDSYYAYMSVNSNSLNSLYRSKVEEFGARGEILEIDGLDQPTESTRLSFTKA